MDTTLQDPLVGQLLEDRYLVIERIAAGGMATVYHALDQRLDRDVALKVLHPHLADDEAFAARFVGEARSAARLSHPNVVGVYDQGRDGAQLFLAMEYLPGRTLRSVLLERGALTPREAFRVLDPVLDALFAAHRAGLVHRDVKPENVILTDDGRVKVADFGLARAASTTSATAGVLLGTVAYLSPELVVHGTADARSDVYAAGVMLFEMLTGRQPFGGDVPAQVAYRHVHEDVPAPSDVVPGVPVALDDVVLAATAREPGERPDDAGALLALLRSARTRVTPDELDRRPDVAGGPAGPVGDGADPDDGLAVTQAVERQAAVANRTQALPGLAAAGGPAAPAARARRRLVPSALPVNEDAGGPPDPSAYARLAEQRRRRGIAVMAMVVVTALVLVAGAYWFIAGPGARVVVPPTATLTQAEATARLTALELTVKTRSETSELVKKGVVVRSEPVTGESVRKGGTVTLVVSSGPPLVEVPAVAGSDRDEAERILVDEDFRIGKVDEEYSDTVDEGDVIRTNPKAGTKRPKGSAVSLVVSRGVEPLAVPDVRNRTPDDAQNALRQAGFTPVLTGETEQSTSVQPGLVSRQDPAPGDRRPPGSEVRLIVSSGADLVDVPWVVGRRVDQAIRELGDRGFQVQLNGDRDNQDAIVISQNPIPGSQQPRGSLVTLEVQGFQR